MIEPDQFKNSEAVSSEEENFERALRPKELVDYVGQEKIREQLEIFIGAAKKKKRTPRPPSFVWTPWFRENNLSTHYCK